MSYRVVNLGRYDSARAGSTGRLRTIVLAKMTGLQIFWSFVAKISLMSYKNKEKDLHTFLNLGQSLHIPIVCLILLIKSAAVLFFSVGSYHRQFSCHEIEGCKCRS